MEKHRQDVFDSAVAPSGIDIGPAVAFSHFPFQESR
jgi:hypothetical protein